jgi:hypothetical protein
MIDMSRSDLRRLFLGYRQFFVDKFQMPFTLYRHSGKNHTGMQSLWQMSANTISSFR